MPNPMPNEMQTSFYSLVLFRHFEGAYTQFCIVRLVQILAFSIYYVVSIPRRSVACMPRLLALWEAGDAKYY